MWSLAFISGVLLYLMVIKPLLRRFGEIQNEAAEHFNEMLQKSVNESKLLQSGDTPTDEHIEKYYKMYLIKFKLDQEEENTWSVEEPMTFEEWKTKLFEYINSGGEGYRFLISNTADIVIGMPPNMVYQRIRDYENMISEYEEIMEGTNE